jgi:hypothetical protein
MNLQISGFPKDFSQLTLHVHVYGCIRSEETREAKQYVPKKKTPEQVPVQSNIKL